VARAKRRHTGQEADFGLFGQNQRIQNRRINIQKAEKLKIKENEKISKTFAFRHVFLFLSVQEYK
jgi:hypothetical protein